MTGTGSLDRALEILEIIGRTPGGLTNAHVSRELGIATSSCSYILGRLERKGFLTREPETGRYCLGLTALTLAHGVLREMGFRSLAEPTLYWLASETGLSASIGVLERGHILLVDRLESPRFIEDATEAARWNQARTIRLTGKIRRREMRDIGRELPVHSNALGKVILAHLPRGEVMQVLDKYGLSRSTPYTIISRERLFTELDQITLR